MVNNLYGNIIDFLGNVLIAITSAGIAWYVSKNESLKSRRKELMDIQQEQKGMLQLLKIENTFNRASFETILESKTNEKKIEELDRLRSSIWDSLKFKLNQPDGVKEDMYLYYYQIETAKELTVSEIESDESLIKRLAEMNSDVLLMLESLIDQVKRP